MLKKLTILFFCFFTISSFSSMAACPSATSSNSPGFCSSFKLAAQCHCTSSGLPMGMCMDMKLLYSRMISTFGSVKRACEFQHDTSVQNCVDDWNCYRSGGKNSQNALCSSTGNVCE